MERTLIKEIQNSIGTTVLLQGWVETIRDMGKIVFIDLRDRTGKVQIVAMKSNSPELSNVSIESVVEVKGEVKKRPENMINAEVENGDVELEVSEFKLLNKSEALPVPVLGDGYDIKEEVRFRYRYLDLRRKRMNDILKKRSEFVRKLRDGLYKRDFVEVETPLLTKATMEGARDFIVPSRMNPGKFYALPQSPQQYKQLLMTAGIERYFQVAKCIRDENLRADRGFEFTQLDIELSFATRQEVMDIVESIVKDAVLSLGGKLKQDTFPVINYKDAIEKYGADKFDLRTEDEKKEGVLAFAWVVNFPFFKRVDKEDVAEVRDGKSGWTFTHNPFSSPVEEHKEWHLKGENIENILTDQYDLVCNGFEVGGGSIRVHEPEVLRATYKIMGYSEEEIEKSIGHMIEAFRVGTPPHGGIALGVDRLVMLLTKEASLKETIAFPMTYQGRTSVMNAPSEVSEEQLKELGLEVLIKKPKNGNEYSKVIRNVLNTAGVKYEYLEHEPTPTSEDAARVRGTKPEEGAKAIILRAKSSGKNYMVVLPGNEKINIKAIENVAGEKLEFEKPEIIKEKYGLVIGGVPPFGYLVDIPTYIDEKLTRNENISFNCGEQTCSIIMKSADLVKIINGEIGNWSLDVKS